jgi:ribosomal protein L37AE/L43A
MSGQGSISREVMHKAGEAPVYYECPACGFLTAEKRFGTGEKACPACGAPADGRRVFPPERLARLDARIRRYHADGDHEIVVILGATFLESLIEDILARIMEAHGSDVRLRALVLDTQRAVGQRIGKLFPALTGEQFEDAAAELGFREFPRRWRRLRTERNAFIHDSAFEGPREELNAATAAEAMELLDQAYRLFVGINNRFVAAPNSRRRP